MGNRKTFQRLVGFGVVFAMSLGLFSGGVGHFNRYTTEAAVKKSEIKLSKEADKAYKEVESLISKSDIKNNFEKLTKTQRVRGTKENKAAGKYIFDTVKGYGYDVKFQNFNGYDEKLIDLNGNINKNQKKEKVLFKGRNIIVKRKDANPKLKTVIFSARYDSNKGSIGALDNAGGVAALMEMARILSDKELSYNPEFVFFDSEHLRRGSRHFAASLSKEEKDNIYGVVNINSIGNKKQRKQMFFASKVDKSELKKQCEKYFPGIVNYKSAETDATTFTLEKIPTLCYFTYDIFASPKDVKIKIKDYVKEKDTSLVDMDTLVYDTAFITTYAYLLKVNNAETGKLNKGYEFESDTSLNVYIDKKLQNKVLDAEPGANTPTIFFVNDKYIGVLCLKGILIFDRNNGKLHTVLNTTGLGFSQTQGDEAILEEADNNYLILHKATKKNGYIYSFRENALSKIDDITKIDMGTSPYKEVKQGEYEKISNVMRNFDYPVKYKDNFVVLKFGENIKDSYVYVLNKKFGEVIKFKIGAVTSAKN